MKNTIIKGLTVTFDKVVDFKQLGTDCFECFFFKNEELLGSKFLTAIELKELKWVGTIDLRQWKKD